ncbi:hypothetical protein CTI14_70875, partial [Methylobacterium radiotolerans]
QARQKFSRDPEAASAARVEEAELLVSLDRVLTLIRAAEYRRPVRNSAAIRRRPRRRASRRRSCW